MDFRKVEKKWQKRWEKKKLFESNPDSRRKFFTSLVIPYVNGNIHIGHSFTYVRTDAYARYKRMLGQNVLLAQGFHATGEPILGAIERLRKGDESQIATFKALGATDKDLEDFRKKGAEYSARFWSKKIAESSRDMGFSIDYRRTFITAIEPAFSRFIEWQYNTLRKMGYVTQGTHPVIWCPHCQSPTGDHDRLKGEGESPVEYVILKFELGDGTLLPAATLRPETIYGVTNIWVNPDIEYVTAKVNNETWIISEEAVPKLRDQLKNVQILGRVHGSRLLGKKCTNPVTRGELFILPAPFVGPKTATGIVMSVPSHAPYDWIAIKELIEGDELEKYGAQKTDVEPVSIVKTDMGEHPAIAVCDKMGIKSQKQARELDEATSIVYKKEFHQGVLKESCGEYSGMKVSGCKEHLVEDFREKGVADAIWETTGEVTCRCTTLNHVKILENQWFLKYSDDAWKKRVRRAMSKMRIVPEEARNNFENTVEWLKDKACTRKTGLGTPLPWDREWIVETLSDSTIYMAYYTIARVINGKKISSKKLTDEVFDFVFLSKGNPKTVAKSSKLPLRLLTEMKKEFEYYYPLDFRNSGKDLIQNHLTFFVFQHAAIFPEKCWPKSVGVNGFVNVEGEKMSKSKGNIIAMKDLVTQYGADLTRLNIVSSAEGIDDADWRAENIKSLRQRYEFMFSVLKDMKKASAKKTGSAELFLLSRLNRISEAAAENYEQLRFRTCVQHILFDSTNALRWYINRAGGIKNADRRILADSMKCVIRLLAPITPHLCEEMWSGLGKGFVSAAAFPQADKKMINAEAEMQEEFLKQTIDDVEQIKKISGISPKKVSVFVSQPWKFVVYNTILKNKGKSINDITKEIMQTDMRKYGNATIGFIQSLYKKINELQPVVQREKQFEILAEAKDFLKAELKCDVIVEDADKSQHEKARQSTPMKAGILLE